MVVRLSQLDFLSDQNPSGDNCDAVLCQAVHLYEGYAVVFRTYVSRKSAGKGKALLEGLGLPPETIEACYVNNPLNEEAAVQDGLNKWRGGHHGYSPTWRVLIDAMDTAGIAMHHIEGIKAALCQNWRGGYMAPAHNSSHTSPPSGGALTRSPSQPVRADTIRTADVLRALDHQLDANWRVFGTFLNIDYLTMNSIEADQRGKSDLCMLDLVSKWVANQNGTSDLPRTWQTVVEAVRDSGFGQLATKLAEKYRVTLSQQ